MSKICLITGSTGFIGSKLLILLDSLGYDIRLLSRRKVPNYRTIVSNFEKESVPASALESVNIVFHLAGFSHDTRNPKKVMGLYQLINVHSTVAIAKLAVKQGVKRFVFISSVKAGGSPSSGHCANEDSQTGIKDIYGESKREAELELLKIGRESGMQVCIIRPSLVYGPEVKGNLQLMLSGIKKGWFPPLPETGNRRSMIHVDDLVRAILLVAEDRQANGEIFIATDGVPHSSREIYNAMCSALDKSIPKWSVPKFLFDMASLISPHIKYKLNKLLGDECYSSTKLETLGFKAKKTLKDMNETSF